MKITSQVKFTLSFNYTESIQEDISITEAEFCVTKGCFLGFLTPYFLTFDPYTVTAVILFVTWRWWWFVWMCICGCVHIM